MQEKTIIIIPVYNEDKVIGQVLSQVLSEFPKVICVDDGSSDNSVKEIKKTKAVLVRHPMNIGQGGALQTGVNFALEDSDADYFVTFDADGQHRIDDVKKMVKEISKGKYDILLGSRFLEKADNIPKAKKIILKLATVFTNRLTGTQLTDTHNGLRVFNRSFAEKLDITMPDMTHGTEIIMAVGRNEFRYKEYPVTIDYTEYSKAKGQPLLNSVNIFFDVLLKYGVGRKK